MFRTITPEVLNMDATLRIQLSSSGHYEEGSRTKFAFDDITLSVACEGAACEGLSAQFGGSFPCQSVGKSTLIADPIQIYEGSYFMDAFTWNEDDGCDAATTLGVGGFPDTEFIFNEFFDAGHHGATFVTTSTNTGLTYTCQLTGDEYECPPVVFQKLGSGDGETAHPLLKGKDAHLEVTIASDGRWYNTASQTADSIRLGITCTGADCNDVGNKFGDGFPCVSEHSGTYFHAEAMLIYEGDWQMKAFMWKEDECNLGATVGVPGFPDTDFVETEIIGEDGDAIIHVESTNTGLKYDCSLQGNVYYCPPVTFREVDLSSAAMGGLDAVVTIEISSNGTFQSRGQQTIDQIRMSVNCTGVDCDSVATGHAAFGGGDGASFGKFPCTSYSDTSMIGKPIQIHDGDFKMDAFLWDTDGCDFTNNMVQIPGFPDTLFAEQEIWDSYHHGARIHTQSQNTGLSYYCNITGDVQTCPPIPFTEITSSTLGMDATITLTMKSQGVWSDSDNMVADAIVLEAFCEGTACEALSTQFGGSFPCASAGSTTFTKFDWGTVAAAAADNDVAAFTALITQPFIEQTLQGNNFDATNMEAYMAEVKSLLAANSGKKLDLTMMRSSVAETHTKINAASTTTTAAGGDGSSDSSSSSGMDSTALIVIIVVIVVIVVLIIPGIAFAIYKKKTIVVKDESYDNPGFQEKGRAQTNPAYDATAGPEGNGYLDIGTRSA